MNPSEKKVLEEIYQLFSGMEKDSADALFDNTMLEQLISLIASFSDSEDAILKKLSSYKNHLNEQMT